MFTNMHYVCQHHITPVILACKYYPYLTEEETEVQWSLTESATDPECLNTPRHANMPENDLNYKMLKSLF